MENWLKTTLSKAPPSVKILKSLKKLFFIPKKVVFFLPVTSSSSAYRKKLRKKMQKNLDLDGKSIYLCTRKTKGTVIEWLENLRLLTRI